MMNKNQQEESVGTEKNLNQVIKIDQARIKSHLGEMVRDTVEETLNVMLDAEADRLCQAQRYERSEARQDQRAADVHRATAFFSSGGASPWPSSRRCGRHRPRVWRFG